MVGIEEYGDYTPSWCPGCGDYSILQALKKAFVGMDLPPHKLALVSGIGQAGKTPHYMRANFFNGLHGRALPAAQGIKLANPELTVVTVSGDGCNYGEGGNHFLAAVRRNVDLTLVVCDNQIYGLTKGQASPTTMTGQVTKAQPFGVPSAAFNPLAVAVAMDAGFVARGFSGEVDQLVGLITQAVAHKGFSLVDVMQPCVSFNKINTFGWYKERCTPLPDDYDPTDRLRAMETALTFGETIPTGVVYESARPPFGRDLPTVGGEPKYDLGVDAAALDAAMASFA